MNRLPLSVLMLGVMLLAATAAMALEVGQKAPEFMLPSTTGGKIGLSQFRDRKAVLLEFYVGESPT